MAGPGTPRGALEALLDAVHHEDDRLGGRAVTRLTATYAAGSGFASILTEDGEEILTEDGDPLTTEADPLEVISTIGFGEVTDGAGDALLLVGGEVIYAESRTSEPPFLFEGIQRGERNTRIQTHPAGTLVIDLSRNTSATDVLRRAFLVRTSQGEDLQVIARNLGLHQCPGMTEEQLRRVVMAVAYLPKNTKDAFEQVMEALFDDTTSWRVWERAASSPWDVFVELVIALSLDIRGRFFLNGGERAETTDVLEVQTLYDVNNVIGVYDDTLLTRRGFREGFTNYYAGGGGSFVGNTITLDSSPGAAGTPVIVDYGAFEGHYLAEDELTEAAEGARPYLADSLLVARCLLDQVRMFGTRVRVRARIT